LGKNAHRKASGKNTKGVFSKRATLIATEEKTKGGQASGGISHVNSRSQQKKRGGRKRETLLELTIKAAWDFS